MSQQWYTVDEIAFDLCRVLKHEYSCIFLSSIQHIKFNGRNLSNVVLCKHLLCLYFPRSCSYRNKIAVLNFAIKIYIGKYSVGIEKSVNGFHENRSGKNRVQQISFISGTLVLMFLWQLKQQKQLLKALISIINLQQGR